MAELSDKRLIVKIVYYGPALSGKTTNLLQLHNFINPSSCGEMMSFETKGDRTLFFDLLPVLIRSEKGYSIKVKLFTVPGQVAHDATRKAVLSRADGVVFVADSQNNQGINNYESFENLEKNCSRVGIDIDNLPLVIQFNKRDLDNIAKEEDILTKWSPTGLPLIFSSAVYGKGVMETFEQILQKVYQNLDREMDLRSKFGFSESHFVKDAIFSGV